jgi:hypothetical protein
MTTSPEYLAHDDIRVAAILALGQFSAEYPAFDDAPLELAVAAMLPAVPAQQAVNAFRLIAGDLATAIDYDTRGAEAVYDLIGAWASSFGRSADEKATETAALHRADARLATEMLCSTQDALAVQS